MLARRAFFLPVVVTGVVIVSIFISLREQQGVLVEESARMGHDRSLLSAELFPKAASGEDSNREGGYGDELVREIETESASAQPKDKNENGTTAEDSLPLVYHYNESFNSSLVNSKPHDSDSGVPTEESTHHSSPQTASTDMYVPHVSQWRNENENEPVHGAGKIKHHNPKWSLHVTPQQRNFTDNSSVKESMQDTVNRLLLYGMKMNAQESSMRLGRNLTEYYNKRNWRLRTMIYKQRDYNLLYSNRSCTVKDVTYRSPTRPRDPSELTLVKENLQKCLEAAELTYYFESMEYTSASRKNAAWLLMQMREVVPVEYSATHTKNSCWKSELNLSLCSRGIIEGHINGYSIAFHGNLLGPQLKQQLHFNRRNISSSTMCLPSIFIPGFPKCGSSFVYCLIRRLFQYKKWMFIEKQPLKEPHFWAPAGPAFRSHWPHNLGDISRYMLNFVPQNSSNYTFSLPIDATPNTMFQWARYSHTEELQNYCLVPSVLPVILPRAKYVVVMRDPVTMIYSAYWFSNSMFCPSLNRLSQILAPDDFHYKVIEKILAYKKCRKFKPVDACLLTVFPPMKGLINYKSTQCGRVRLEVGFYYYYIRRWLAVIPREQFLFIKTEDLKSDLLGVTKSLSDFFELGLDIKYPYPSTAHKQKCENVQTRFDYRKDPELQMRNDTRDLLYKFFDPFNQKLAELLQDSKFHWKPPQ